MPKRALVVIDMLNDFLRDWEKVQAAALISKTNELVRAFRQAGAPVVWVRQAFKPDLSDAFLEMRDKGTAITIEGTDGARIHSGLERHADDIVIIKKRYSAFFGTNLDEVIAAAGIDELVLCGVNTHACIRIAAIDAYQRDIRVVLASDCVSSYDEEHARVSLAYMDGKIARVAGNADIIRSLNE
ncbi:MAG: isochorismatase family cysteine hydrolase [Parvibaculum sp.]|nr:isochorismatase family cysteine hydrolase [Parvibaculum sp.]